MLNKIKHYGVRSLLGACLLVVLSATAALAQTGPSDPTGGAASDMFSDLTSFATGVLLPAAAALVIIGIAFKVGVKWVRRGANS